MIKVLAIAVLVMSIILGIVFAFKGMTISCISMVCVAISMYITLRNLKKNGK